MATGRDNSTFNGYALDEAISALQKEVRRGKDNASFWALEIFFVGEGPTRTNLWNRLLVISMEDIGMADPLAVLAVISCCQKGRDDPYLLVAAVNYLVKAKKTRVIDWAIHWAELKYKNNDATGHAIEQLVVDLSEGLKSKDLDRSLIAMIALHQTTEPVKNRKFRKAWNLIPEIISEIMSGYGYVKTLSWIWEQSSWKFTGKSLLIFCQLIFLWVHDQMPIISEVRLNSSGKSSDLIIEVKEKRRLLQIPDYAIDKHTAQGRRKGRDFQHFLLEGSRLENINPEWESMSVEYLEVILQQ